MSSSDELHIEQKGDLLAGQKADSKTESKSDSKAESRTSLRTDLRSDFKSGQNERQLCGVLTNTLAQLEQLSVQKDELNRERDHLKRLLIEKQAECQSFCDIECNLLNETTELKMEFDRQMDRLKLDNHRLQQEKSQLTQENNCLLDQCHNLIRQLDDQQQIKNKLRQELQNSIQLNNEIEQTNSRFKTCINQVFNSGGDRAGKLSNSTQLQQKSEQASEQVSEQASEQTSEQASEPAPEQGLQQKPVRKPEQGPQSQQQQVKRWQDVGVQSRPYEIDGLKSVPMNEQNCGVWKKENDHLRAQLYDLKHQLQSQHDVNLQLSKCLDQVDGCMPNSLCKDYTKQFLKYQKEYVRLSNYLDGLIAKFLYLDDKLTVLCHHIGLTKIRHICDKKFYLSGRPLTLDDYLASMEYKIDKLFYSRK